MHFRHRQTDRQTDTVYITSRAMLATARPSCSYSRRRFTTLCLNSIYHPSTNDNFNSSSPIPIIFGTNITERICDRNMKLCFYTFIGKSLSLFLWQPNEQSAQHATSESPL